MAGTSVYDAIVKFVGDYGELKTGLPTAANAAAAAAGTSAGGIFGGKFGGVFKTTVGALAGAGVGLLLKAVTQGAVELDAATRKYQADTGATMEQTKLAGDQINALFRSNVDSYSTVGDVLSKLATDLHITGDAAQATAQEFLNFAHATGQEPVAATDALTTAIKAFRLPADQIPGLMDQIVKGHQLYGGSVSANIDTLARLAPAILAANLNINDATGLLNLFAAAGLDASKAPIALQTALTKVHSPEELKAMLAQIQATPDNFERAKLAIALFGTRAGAQLADALAPGTKALADYQVSAADAAGATDQAAASIDQGFGNQVVMAFHNVEGAMSGFAQNAQGAVAVLDALGNMGINILPALGTAVGAAIPQLWGKLKSLAPGFKDAGRVMGEAAAIGEVEAEATGVAAGQAVVAAETAPAAIVAGEALGTTMGTGVGTGLLGSLRALLPKILAGLFAGASIGGLDETQVWKDAGAAYAKSFGKGSTPVMAADGKAAGLAATDGLSYGLTTGTPAVMNTVTTVTGGITRGMQTGIMQGMAALGNLGTVAVADLVKTFGTGMKGVLAAAHNLGHATGVEGMLAMAQGIVAAENTPLDAFTAMLALMKTELTPQAEAARLAGELTSDSLAKGLTDKRPAVRAQAIATKEAILDRLVVLAEQSGPIGAKAMAELAKGMKDKDPEIRAMAKSAHDAVIAELDKTPAGAATAGAATGTAFVAAFLGKIKDDLVLPTFPVSSSAPRKGLPGQGLASGGPVSARTPYLVNENTARSEIFMADVPGRILTPSQAGQAGQGGQTININGPIQLADAHDEFSLVQSLRFLATVQA